MLANALLFDGSGSPPQRGSLAVRGGRIAEIRAQPAEIPTRESAPRPPLPRPAASDCEVIDCGGLALAPGFIDVHSHSDAYALLRPDAPSKITQGVTTEIVGQCGASASPLVGGAKLPSDWASFEYPRAWRNISEYLAALHEAEPLVNIVPMTGHRNLRMAVMGMEPRPAAPREIAQMAELLESELEGGSTGFTVGLAYQPACHSAEEEIIALAKVCARRGGIFATHLRSEGAALLEALDEAIRAAEESGAQLQISHFKTSGAANWTKLEAAIEKIEAARARGIRVFADRYPYTASGTDLDIILPEWAERGSREEILARLADAGARKKIAAELDSTRPPEYWQTVMVGGTWSPASRSLRGRRIDEIAREWKLPPAETLLRIVERDGLRTGGFFFGMSEENLARILSFPWVMIGSDASLRAGSGILSEDHPHPRAWGAFPAFFALCREKKLMPLEEAVRRVTGLPAETFALRERGQLKSGFIADLVLFNPNEISARATYESPSAPSAGIEAVFVRGKRAWQQPVARRM